MKVTSGYANPDMMQVFPDHPSMWIAVEKIGFRKNKRERAYEKEANPQEMLWLIFDLLLSGISGEIRLI